MNSRRATARSSAPATSSDTARSVPVRLLAARLLVASRASASGAAASSRRPPCVHTPMCVGVSRPSARIDPLPNWPQDDTLRGSPHCTEEALCAAAWALGWPPDATPNRVICARLLHSQLPSRRSLMPMSGHWSPAFLCGFLYIVNGYRVRRSRLVFPMGNASDVG